MEEDGGLEVKWRADFSDWGLLVRWLVGGRKKRGLLVRWGSRRVPFWVLDLEEEARGSKRGTIIQRS